MRRTEKEETKKWAIERATVAVNPVTSPVNALKGAGAAGVAAVEADSEVYHQQMSLESHTALLKTQSNIYYLSSIIFSTNHPTNLHFSQLRSDVWDIVLPS